MTARELIENKIEVNRTIEELGGFSQDFQILYLVDRGYINPKMLMDKMGILKTNLSLICRKLLDNNYIAKMQSESNKKLIAYCLTQKGKQQLTKKLKEMEEKINENI